MPRTKTPATTESSSKAPSVRPPTAKQQRAATAKLHAEEKKAKKLHTIAERRAKAEGMDKKQFIAAVVAGKYPPITAEDIANEPNPTE
jgi:hypothetical protein